ncbi:MAG: thymidine phosphorylase [Gaiellaceae bacterium]
MRAVDLIARKRDGQELGADELRELILAYTRDEVPDYQMSAFLMATFFRGMTAAETVTLTEAMVESGDVIDLTSLGRPAVDKHSTGGVGDKTSIALGPLVAACDVPFAKMSGRGLGHTGGTLDKLEAIPGFRVELDEKEFVSQIGEVGMAIVSQTPTLVPADARLYALRDVTATVGEISLIAASTMSKKIASGASAILLDVKVGNGAFMRTIEEARELAQAMVELGKRAGREVRCELTDMAQPLGCAVGNALEIIESVETLRGNGPTDFTELIVSSATHLLQMSDLDIEASEAARMVKNALESGAALAAYERWIVAQGGDPSLDVLPRAALEREVTAESDGYVTGLDALAIGIATVHLGAGRARKQDAIDHSTGIVCRRKLGDPVAAGEPLAVVYARTDAEAEQAAIAVRAAYEVSDEAPTVSPLVLELLA